MKTKNQDFKSVQKALAWKRHEQPPPRYFRSFSSDVLDRLNSPPPPGSLPWYERLGFGEDWKPAMLVVLGLAVCAVLAVGWAVSRMVEPPEDEGTDAARDPAAALYAAPPAPGSDLPEGLSTLPGLDANSSNAVPAMTPVWVDSPAPSPSPAEETVPGG